jgi:dipeptidase E
MRLYLSSFRMGDSFDELLAMTDAALRVAVVSNAVDFIPDEARRAYAQTVFDPIRHFADHGRRAFDLDLRRYFADPSALKDALADVGLVWTVGGNAFLLRRAMRQSGFDDLLTDALAEDRLAYGGWSAGAVVAGPTLRGIEVMDDPSVLAEGYGAEAVWEGLGLVGAVIVPHVGSDHPEADAAARAVRSLAAQGVAHIALRDGEVLIVNGGPPQLRPVRT